MYVSHARIYFLSGTISNFIKYWINDICAKLGAFVHHVNILSQLTNLIPDTQNYHNAMAKWGLWSLVNCHLSYPTFAVRETASLGIMGAPRVPPLNPSESIVLSEHYRLWGVQGGHNGLTWWIRCGPRLATRYCRLQAGSE